MEGWRKSALVERVCIWLMLLPAFALPGKHGIRAAHRIQPNRAGWPFNALPHSPSAGQFFSRVACGDSGSAQPARLPDPTNLRGAPPGERGSCQPGACRLLRLGRSVLGAGDGLAARLLYRRPFSFFAAVFAAAPVATPAATHRSGLGARDAVPASARCYRRSRLQLGHRSGVAGADSRGSGRHAASSATAGPRCPG